MSGRKGKLYPEDNDTVEIPVGRGTRPAARSPRDQKRQRLGVRLLLLSVPAVVVSVNAVAVYFIPFFADFMFSKPVRQLNDVFSASRLQLLASQMGPFFPVVAAAMIVLSPVFRAFWSGQAASQASALSRRRLLATPPLMALLSAGGWLMGVAVFLGFHAASGALAPGFYAQNIAQTSVLAGFSFVLSYYGTELVVRQGLIPRLFREEEVLAERSLDHTVDRGPACCLCGFRRRRARRHAFHVRCGPRQRRRECPWARCSPVPHELRRRDCRARCAHHLV